jgi:hypothetical protein
MMVSSVAESDLPPRSPYLTQKSVPSTAPLKDWSITADTVIVEHQGVIKSVHRAFSLKASGKRAFMTNEAAVSCNMGVHLGK